MGIAILTALLLAALRENLPAMASSHGGAEFLKDLVGNALANMDASSRLQVVAAVEDSFRKIFMIAAGVAVVPFALVATITDEVLSDRM
jgi:hypothetical protein